MAVVNAAEFARLFDLTPQRVGDLIAQGLPAGGRGRRGSPRRIDVALAHAWLVAAAVAKVRTPDGGMSLEAAELEKARADARLAAVKADVAENKVIDLSAAEQTAERAGILFATQLDGLAGRLASRLAAEPDAAICAQLIAAETRRIRSVLASEFEKMATADGNG